MVHNGGRAPFAVWDPIRGRSTRRNNPQRMTVHIAVARSGDIYGPGKGPGGTYAHAYSPRSGRLRQHQEIHRKTYADLDGNGSTVSVEHEGWPGQRLTPSQIDNDARLFAYLVLHHGVKNRIATWDDTRGLAWHRLGCQGNFGRFNRHDRKTWSTAQTGVRWSTAFGKTCPTDEFIDQIEEIFDRAQVYIAGKVPISGGSKGASMSDREIQRALAELGYYDGRIDGKYGPMTKAAVKRYQRQAGLYVDGWWGPKTQDYYEEHDMGLTSDDRKWIRDEIRRGFTKHGKTIADSNGYRVWSQIFRVFKKHDSTIPAESAGDRLKHVRADLVGVRKDLNRVHATHAAQSAAISALAGSRGLDPEQVQQTLTDAVDAAVHRFEQGIDGALDDLADVEATVSFTDTDKES